MNSFIDPKIKHNISAELTKALYRNYPASMLSTILIASVLLWELSGPIEKKYLMGWYAAFWVILLYRFLLVAWYHRTKTQLHLHSLHYYLFLLGASLTSLLWGILGSFLMPNDIIHQTFILIIISGILAGSLQSLSPSYLGSMIYLAFIMLPILTWQTMQISQGIHIYISIFILMFLYCVFSAIITYRVHSILINHIKIKFENIKILESLSKAKFELENSNKKLKKYTAQIELLNTMGTLLRTHITQEEAFTISVQFMSKMFPEFSGGFYLFSETKEDLNAIKTWGEIPIEQLEFSADNCWAIRLKQTHLSNNSVHCTHSNKSIGFYECIPLIAQGEMLGIMYIQKINEEFPSSSEQNLVVRSANDIALTIANIKLNNDLKKQVTHDLLTGLFNRRFLSEYFEIEIAQAKRNNLKISVIMLDIDNFKHFNDSFGHKAGDTILQEFGKFLNQRIRSSDIACRYGGEEFIIVMPNTSTETARQRAELLREEVKNLPSFKNNNSIEKITLSLGIATFPLHGSTTEEIINAADKAMYQAKQTGRDRICLATDNKF